MNRRSIPIILIVALLIAVLPHAAMAQEADARLRIIHAVEDAPAVDLYVDGTLAAQDVAFGDVTHHFRVPAGARTIEARPAGSDASSPAVINQAVDLTQELAFSLVLQGASTAPEGVLYEDILDPLALGLSRLAAIHAVPGANEVDLLRADGAPLMVGLTYAQSYGTINIPVGEYELVTAPNGGTAAEAIAELAETNLQTNLLYTLLILPDSDGVSMTVLESPVNIGADSAFTRLIHAADAPAVDLYINDTLVLVNFQEGMATRHVGFPLGEHTLALRETGTPPNSEAIFEVDFSVEAGAQSFAIVLDGDELSVERFDDAAGEVVSDTARLQIQNLTGEAIEFEITGDALPSTVTLDNETSQVDLAPGRYEIAGGFSLEADLFGGTLYSLLVIGDDVVWGATPLDVTLDSVPFIQPEAVEVAAAEDTTNDATTDDNSVDNTASDAETTPETAETEVAAEEAAPAQEEQAEVVPAPPTEAPAPAAEQPQSQPAPPVQQESPPPVQPVQPPPQPNARPTRPGVYPPVELVFGVVNLNSGVSLHCREYPTSAARSIGLIPNGTEMLIDGVAGPRDETGEFGRTDALTIDNVPDFTDLLEDDFTIADFPPGYVESWDQGDIWLNTTWTLEDGTPFGCWTNAEFIAITFDDFFINEIPEYLQLIEGTNLLIVPYNAPGGPRDPDDVVNPASVSAPTPIPAGPEVIANVNVNQGVNLQLRLRPGSDEESIGLIPGGSQLVVLGKTDVAVSGDIGDPTIPEWLNVEFTLNDGTTIRGWISAEFVLLTANGSIIEPSEVDDVEEIEAGGIVVDGVVVSNNSSIAPQAPAPPPQAQQADSRPRGRLLVDPNTNVNLRSQPSPDSLVVVSVPPNAELFANGRNAAGDWVRVEFVSATGTVEGWTLADFLQLSLNGQPYDIGDLEIVTN